VWEYDKYKKYFKHVMNRQYEMSSKRFFDILYKLDYQNLTKSHVRELCPRKIFKLSRNLGVDKKYFRDIYRDLANMQSEMNRVAEQNGYPVDKYNYGVRYAPSPFLQSEDGPINPRHLPGMSSGPCNDMNPCTDGTVCQDGLCVIPDSERTCPPFQFTFPYMRKSDGRTLNNIKNFSAQRTRKREFYSPRWNKNISQCVFPRENDNILQDSKCQEIEEEIKNIERQMNALPRIYSDIYEQEDQFNELLRQKIPLDQQLKACHSGGTLKSQTGLLEWVPQNVRTTFGYDSLDDIGIVSDKDWKTFRNKIGRQGDVKEDDYLLFDNRTLSEFYADPLTNRRVYPQGAAIGKNMESLSPKEFPGPDEHEMLYIPPDFIDVEENRFEIIPGFNDYGQFNSD